MIRRFGSYLTAATIATALTGGIAADASGRPVARAAVITCGNLYQPHCTAPAIGRVTLGVGCHAASSVISLPAFTVRSTAGLKSIKITVNGKTTVILAKKLRGANQATIRGVKIRTGGFRSGVHTITIKLVDERNRSASRTVHFAICKPPKPPFTG